MYPEVGFSAELLAVQSHIRPETLNPKPLTLNFWPSNLKPKPKPLNLHRQAVETVESEAERRTGDLFVGGVLESGLRVWSLGSFRV